MAPGKKGKELPVQEIAPTKKGILEELPEPIAKLDMGDLDNLPANYENFIEDIRGAVTSEVGFNFTFEGEQGKDRQIPVTPGKDDTPAGFFTFELSDEQVRLRVVCDKYQLWLRGIVTNEGNRFEIDEKDKAKVIVGSESLRTTGMYPHLLEGDRVNTVKIGYQALIASFHKLARHLKNQRNDHFIAIAVLLVMIFEAARIKELYDLSLRLLKTFADEQVGPDNKLLINNWSDTCRDFYVENGDTKDVRITGSTGTATKKVANSIYVLCRSPLDRWIARNKRI